jgi:hypothetical protein
MHTNQTFNFLIIDDSNKILFPIPEAAKGLSNSIDWTEVSWTCIGLPAFDCHFSIASGGQLYLEKDSANNPCLKKSEFTGTVHASTIFIPEDENYNVYFVKVEICFCKGKVSGVEMVEFETQTNKDYKQKVESHQSGVFKEIKMRNSWWFKYLYVPYFYFIKFIVMVVVVPIELILKFFIQVAEKLVPFGL